MNSGEVTMGAPGDAADARLRYKLHALAKRGAGAVWSSPVFGLILLAVAPTLWRDEYRTLLYVLTGVVGFTSTTRAMLIWPLHHWIERTPHRWQTWWIGLVLTNGAAWGLVFAWSIGSGGEIQSAVAISLAGLCAGAMISAIPSWRLIVVFELVTLGPSIVASIARATRLDLGMAALILLLLAFLLGQGRQVNRKFWDAYDLQLSLLERTNQMEKAVWLAGERQAELEDSEERHRILFECSPLPMLLCDLDSQRFVAVNTQAVQKYGYSIEEFLGMRMPQIEVSQDHDPIPEPLPGPSGEAPPATRWRHRKKDGTIMDVIVTSHPIEWLGRTALLMVSIDITSRVRAERERDEMEVLLRHANKLESIGQLAAGVAHEINTPTQYIGDNLHFLRDAFDDVRVIIETQQRILPLMDDQASLRGPAAELRQVLDTADVGYLMIEMPKALDQALDGIGRVSTLVRAMKEFSHPGTRDKTAADLNAAIQSTITVARNEWKYVARLQTHLDPSLPMVPCFVSDFNQVILNLIVNAAHAIAEVPHDGGSPERLPEGLGLIAISTRRSSAGYAEIQVRDTGTGIPANVRDRIFDPFFTTKRMGKGTGQGLALARSIVVDKHGGTLHFETEAGRGTTFVIRLPLDGETPIPERDLLSSEAVTALSRENWPCDCADGQDQDSWLGAEVQ